MSTKKFNFSILPTFTTEIRGQEVDYSPLTVAELMEFTKKAGDVDYNINLLVKKTNLTKPELLSLIPEEFQSLLRKVTNTEKKS